MPRKLRRGTAPHARRRGRSGRLRRRGPDTGLNDEYNQRREERDQRVANERDDEKRTHSEDAERGGSGR